jgi:hypothetical protein
VKRLPAALLLALPCLDSVAATAYVTDQLVLGVYSQQNQQGQHLATLHSGASVEVLAASGDYSQVRLPDGTTGWVKTTYLTPQLPATAMIKQLQEELDRMRATTPALAEAAAHSEVRAAQGGAPPSRRKWTPCAATWAAAGSAPHPYRTLLAMVLALGLGFWLGYVTLARRVKHKFGGIKVY